MITNSENKKCGLIGKKLGHSFSPLIHSNLANYSYSLFEMDESELEAFIRDVDFCGVNVTIPYKVEITKYLDCISPEAEKIGCVNTVIKRNGKTYGFNTDYYGLKYLIEKNGIKIKDADVLILGTGGSSLTAKAVCSDMGAKSINFVSRSGDINYENVYSLYPNTDVIVNTSPAGMYPKNGECHIELDKFTKLSGVVDIIFNPSKTKLLMDAESLGIRHANGLPMLVAQAKAACEIFVDEKISDSEIDRITKIIEDNTKNIVLVGMPGCGKSHIGRLVAEKLGRELIDTDEEIVKDAGMPIPEIFAKYGEEVFRKYEHEVILRVGKLSGKVISTGGGVVTRENNYEPLHQNSKIVFIERDISSLPTNGRPLSQANSLTAMYEKRLPMYKRFADVSVKNDSTPYECANKIINS